MDLTGVPNHDPTITTDDDANSANCRTWTYSNNELHGYYNTILESGRNWYIYYDSNSKSFKDRKDSGDGSIHIYEVTDPYTLVSFNGYDQ